MDVISLVLSLLVFVFALAVFANKFRRTHRLHFDLKANCLLTRWPIVFVTGPRSLFYFSHYWNLYPVFLAEHGYEVFTVHMPWKSREGRRSHFKNFLEMHKGKRYHFVVDAATFEELKDLLWGNDTAHTVTELRNAGTDASAQNTQVYSLEMLETARAGFLLSLSFKIHRLMIRNPKAPTLNTLAALPASAFDNSRLLLNRMQEVAETDYQES